LTTYLKITAETSDSLSIQLNGEGSEDIPKDETNLVYRSFSEFYRHIGKLAPLMKLQIDNDIPTNGGLGASGAAIVGGILIANELSLKRLPKAELLGLATDIEGHPDNVSATLFGGLTVNCYDDGHWRSISIPVAPALKIVAAIPSYRVLTSDARKALPPELSLLDAVHNIAHTAFIVSSIQSGSFDVLSFAMSDKIHERYRSQLIPGYNMIREAGIRSGALSVNISGSGSTVVAFTLRNENAIGASMVDAFGDSGIKASYRIFNVDNEGAVLRGGPS
jgi:homoserine kinase